GQFKEKRRKQGPLSQHEQRTHELTETDAACTGPARVCSRSSATLTSSNCGDCSVVRSHMSRRTSVWMPRAHENVG
ncbi:hypothetical protein LEMLEM_LOCUS18049, partial [Lemmus lemmus]